MENFSGDLVPFVIGLIVLIGGASIATGNRAGLIGRIVGFFVAVVGLGIAWAAGTFPARLIVSAIGALAVAIGIGIATRKGGTQTMLGGVLIAGGILVLVGTNLLPAAPFVEGWHDLVQAGRAARHGFKKLS